MAAVQNATINMDMQLSLEYTTRDLFVSAGARSSMGPVKFSSLSSSIYSSASVILRIFLRCRYSSFSIHVIHSTFHFPHGPASLQGLEIYIDIL